VSKFMFKMRSQTSLVFSVSMILPEPGCGERLGPLREGRNLPS
jgi:hypothetical protein